MRLRPNDNGLLQAAWVRLGLDCLDCGFELYSTFSLKKRMGSASSFWSSTT